MPSKSAEIETDGVMMALAYDVGLLGFDLVVVGGDSPRLARDGALETAVIISLFTDLQDPTDPANDLGGYWGDAYADVPGDKIGSLLWTLAGQRIDADLVRKARKYSEDALAWMLADGIAESIEVVTTVTDGNVHIKIAIAQPGDAAPRWFGIWDLLGRKFADASA